MKSFLKSKGSSIPAMVILLLMSSICAFAGVHEYDLKAVYIERITRFLHWPESDVTEAESFVIGVIGDNPFGDRLQEIYRDRKMKGKSVSVRTVSLKEAHDCTILFIAESEKLRLDEILKHVTGKPILTIGDTEGFAEAGVMVNFVIEEGKLRFVINQASFHKAGIEVDSLMIKVAKVIEPLKSKDGEE